MTTTPSRLTSRSTMSGKLSERLNSDLAQLARYARALDADAHPDALAGSEVGRLRNVATLVAQARAESEREPGDTGLDWPT